MDRFSARARDERWRRRRAAATTDRWGPRPTRRCPDGRLGCIYVVGGRGYSKWAYFRCPADRNEIVQLSLMLERRPRWTVAADWLGRPTIEPSVRKLDGLYAHFWIKKGASSGAATAAASPQGRHSRRALKGTCAMHGHTSLTPPVWRRRPSPHALRPTSIVGLALDTIPETTKAASQRSGWKVSEALAIRPGKLRCSGA